MDRGRKLLSLSALWADSNSWIITEPHAFSFPLLQRWLETKVFRAAYPRHQNSEYLLDWRSKVPSKQFITWTNTLQFKLGLQVKQFSNFFYPMVFGRGCWTTILWNYAITLTWSPSMHLESKCVHSIHYPFPWKKTASLCFGKGTDWELRPGFHCLYN